MSTTDYLPGQSAKERKHYTMSGYLQLWSALTHCKHLKYTTTNYLKPGTATPQSNRDDRLRAMFTSVLQGIMGEAI